MAFNLENMTVDYKKLLSLVPTQRAQLAQSGTINDMISALTPGQLVNLFPRYYRDQLPDVGQINRYSASLDGALSGALRQQGVGSTGTTYLPPGSEIQTTLTPTQKSLQQLYEKAGLSQVPLELSGDKKEKAAELTERMMSDLGIPREKAVAIVGNFMHESADFNTMQEVNPQSGRGGYGWAQWTGVRRNNFEKFAAERGLDINSDEANYQYFLHEIQNDPYEREKFEEWKNADYGSVASETVAFENAYERAGVKHHGSRIQRAETALQAYEQRVAKIESDVNAIKDLNAVQPQFDASMLNQLDERYRKHYETANEGEKRRFEQALTKLGPDAFNEVMKNQPVNNATLQAVGNLSTADSRFSVLGGNIEGVDPRLVSVIKSSSNDLPEGFTVKMISGKDPRETGTLNHPNGLAMDVQIYDNEGKLVPHNKNSPRWKYYEMLYRSSNIRGKEMYPDQEFIWGGAWISNAAGRGDPMHYQIVNRDVVGTSTSSGRYSFESGLDPSHPFVAEGGQLTADEREAYDSTIRQKIETEKAKAKEQEKKIKDDAEAIRTADPVAAAQAIQEQNEAKTKTTTETQPTPVVAPPPSFANGGEIVPGEDVAGVNLKTGNVEFMANSREKIRIDPAELENTQQMPVITQEDTKKLETSNQPLQIPASRPEPKDNSDPNLYNVMAEGYTSIPPSVLRATNRAKLYGEDSSGVVNGHFA